MAKEYSPFPELIPPFFRALQSPFPVDPKVRAHPDNVQNEGELSPVIRLRLMAVQFSPNFGLQNPMAKVEPVVVSSCVVASWPECTGQGFQPLEKSWKPGKWKKLFPHLEKSWNLKKSTWKNYGILSLIWNIVKPISRAVRAFQVSMALYIVLLYIDFCQDYSYPLIKATT